MSKAGSELAERILAELSELTPLPDRVLRAWQTVVNKNDEFYLDSVALNLHGFYSGLERIFERIASSVSFGVHIPSVFLANSTRPNTLRSTSVPCTWAARRNSCA